MLTEEQLLLSMGDNFRQLHVGKNSINSKVSYTIRSELFDSDRAVETGTKFC